jgi:hypothetical protein
MFPDNTLCAYSDITVTYVMGTGNIFRAKAIHCPSSLIANAAAYEPS